MKTSDILNAAADDIERNGWTQGNHGTRVSGPHCALGAIGAASECDEIVDYGYGPSYNPTAVTDSPAGMALCEFLGQQHTDVNAIWGWNDDQESAGPVIEAMRAAALIEAAKDVEVTVVRSVA